MNEMMNDGLVEEKVKPLLRGHFHQAMFFVALGACIPMILRCDTTLETIAMTVYSLCALIMFGVSSLYHRINWNNKKRLLWRKLDHSGIFLMIAGCFTPVCLLALNENSGKTLLIIIWSVAVAGIIMSVFLSHLPKIIRASVYVVASYTILPYVNELKAGVGDLNFWLIVTGGVFYTVGAMFYAFKRPKLNPKVFSYHEIFHIFVNIAAAIHFYVISSLIE